MFDDDLAAPPHETAVAESDLHEFGCPIPLSLSNEREKKMKSGKDGQR